VAELKDDLVFLVADMVITVSCMPWWPIAGLVMVSAVETDVPGRAAA